MKSRFFIAAVMVFMAETLFALSLGQKEIKMFTNEVVKCAKDVFSYDGEESGNAYVIKLRNRKIRDILIDSATIKWDSSVVTLNKMYFTSASRLL